MAWNAIIMTVNTICPGFVQAQNFTFAQEMPDLSEDLTVEKLLDLVDPKNPPLLKELGGPVELTRKLGSNVEKVRIVDDRD
jgi:hypothetical protein